MKKKKSIITVCWDQNNNLLKWYFPFILKKTSDYNMHYKKYYYSVSNFISSSQIVTATSIDFIKWHFDWLVFTMLKNLKEKRVQNRTQKTTSKHKNFFKKILLWWKSESDIENAYFFGNCYSSHLGLFKYLNKK